MFKLYEEYLQVIDKYLFQCFESQKPFIHCKAGCTDCCDVGEYPFSRLEMEYLMKGFINLPTDIKHKVKQNIRELLEQKSMFTGRFLHKCPFLIDKMCVVYEYRGIICRTFGLACFELADGKRVVKLPECSKIGLNYAEVLDNGYVDMEKFKSYNVDSPVKHSLSLDFFEREILKDVQGLEFGETRPILDWFIEKSLRR